MPTDDYNRGLKDGELIAIENALKDVLKRVENHEERITAQERIVYAFLGVIAFVEVLPSIQGLLGG